MEPSALRHRLFRPDRRTRAVMVYRDHRAQGWPMWHAYLAAAKACGKRADVRRNAAQLLAATTNAA